MLKPCINFSCCFLNAMKVMEMTKKKMNTVCTHSEEEHRTFGKKDTTTEVLEKLLKNQTLNKLPSNEPSTFDGEDVTEYRSFVISFESLIERNCSLDEDKYYYLMKYTKKDAHELVKSCFDKDAKKA